MAEDGTRSLPLPTTNRRVVAAIAGLRKVRKYTPGASS